MMPCPSTLPLQYPPPLPRTAPSPEAVPSSLPQTSVVSRGTTQPRQPPSLRPPPTAAGGFPPCPFGMHGGGIKKKFFKFLFGGCFCLRPLQVEPLPPCAACGALLLPAMLPSASYVGARRARGLRRRRHCLPPIRDAPCLHGGVLPPTRPLARSRALLPAAVVPPPCRPAPSRAAHNPIAPYVKPPPFLALGGAPMPPRPLAASASARFSPRPRVAASRPCRCDHVRLQPSAGQQGGSVSATSTHRPRGLSSHPFGMPLACTGVFCHAHAPSPEAVPSSLPQTSVVSRGTTQPRQPPSLRQPPTAVGGFPPCPFGVFHLHPVVLRSDGTRK